MKKICVYFFLFIVVFIFGETDVIANSDTKIIPIAVNDQLITFPDEKPVLKDQITYVPIRIISEAIDATLTIDLPNETFRITTKEKSMLFDVKNSKIKTLDGSMTNVNLYKQNGRNFAPLRVIGEYFSYDVQYISNGPVVRLVNSKAKLDRNQFIKANQNAISNFYNKPIVDHRPKVYITFDDGPIKGTEEILEVLKKKKAKASFFMIETQMRLFPNQTKRIVSEGHYPALHSVTHNKNLLYGGNSIAVAKEMLKTQKTLFELTGFHSNLTRAPYGSKPYMKIAFRDELVRNDFKMWDWSIDSEDWKYHQTDPKEIVANVKGGIQKQKSKKEPIVILFHINKGTAAVLPEIIDYIYAEGYQCVAYDPAEHFVMNFWKDERL
ncbi:polysaccharide deacetylase family protein [Bacillus sp. CGMCC 1.16607]|uniref:polysaccharide deacetylase family protein n=1 Tax=Bacillus sp. CGMCC 1.16607 TaxID=3351842 RepID=UPI0036272641